MWRHSGRRWFRTRIRAPHCKPLVRTRPRLHRPAPHRLAPTHRHKGRCMILWSDTLPDCRPSLPVQDPHPPIRRRACGVANGTLKRRQVRARRDPPLITLAPAWQDCVARITSPERSGFRSCRTCPPCYAPRVRSRFNRLRLPRTLPGCRRPSTHCLEARLSAPPPRARRHRAPTCPPRATDIPTATARSPRRQRAKAALSFRPSCRSACLRWVRPLRVRPLRQNTIRPARPLLTASATGHWPQPCSPCHRGRPGTQYRQVRHQPRAHLTPAPAAHRSERPPHWPGTCYRTHRT